MSSHSFLHFVYIYILILILILDEEMVNDIKLWLVGRTEKQFQMALRRADKDKPKKPPAKLVLYYRELIASGTCPGLNRKDYEAIASRFEGLPDETKRDYHDKYVGLLDQYKKQLELYDQNQENKFIWTKDEALKLIEAMQSLRHSYAKSNLKFTKSVNKCVNWYEVSDSLGHHDCKSVWMVLQSQVCQHKTLRSE